MATKRAKAAEAPDPLHHARRLQELISEFGVEAMVFTAKPKVEDTVHQWLARANLDPDDPHSADTVAQALMLALELAMFAPSLSGSTAVGRLVRQRIPSNGEERAALEALQQASFQAVAHPLFRSRWRFAGRSGSGRRVKHCRLLDRDIPVAATGIAFAARLCPLTSAAPPAKKVNHEMAPERFAQRPHPKSRVQPSLPQILLNARPVTPENTRENRLPKNEINNCNIKYLITC